ncbi:MAG TPA: nucleoside hydrolase, partial [Thermomicrobiales bacterium]|nr:nucleoside hydrolase [Thermomicrobiales bacterium]
RLVGVSTVAGNVPDHVATANTLSVLAWLGAEPVPVHRGASRPLALPYYDAVQVHGGNGLGGAELGGSAAKEARTNGVQAILDAAEAHDGLLVLAALGPLTNLAMALSIRPGLVDQVQKLTLMCGAFTIPGNVTQHAEYNAFADPDAASQVMGARWNELLVVGLDVTHQTIFARDQWDALEEDGSASAELVRRITERTFKERGVDALYLHDPLAVAVALDDSLLRTEQQAVSVNTAGDDHRGKTTLAGNGAARIALQVDAERFERWCAELLDLPASGKREPRDRIE